MKDRETSHPERFRELVHGHLDGSLTAKERAELERLTASNPDLSRELDSFARLQSLSRTARPEPPPGFASRVMVRITRPEGADRPERSHRGFFGSLFPFTGRPAFAGALAL